MPALPVAGLSAALYCVLFIALGFVALSGTWSQVLQWILTYELPRHRSMFLRPWQWPSLFLLAFRDFMGVDGGANEVGLFLECTLAGPTILFMLYTIVTTLRLRVPQGKIGVAALEIGGWLFLDGLVAPSTAIPLYFAWRAAPILIDQVWPSSNSKASSGAHERPKPHTSLLPPRLVSLVVAMLYALIVATACSSCWKHLSLFVAEHKTAHGVIGAAWTLVRGKEAATHGLMYWFAMLAKDLNANPITRNLAIDTLFTSLAISLHTMLGSPSQQPRGLTLSRWIMALLSAPVLTAANLVSGGSIWALSLIVKEMLI